LPAAVSGHEANFNYNIKWDFYHRFICYKTVRNSSHSYQSFVHMAHLKSLLEYGVQEYRKWRVMQFYAKSNWEHLQ